MRVIVAATVIEGYSDKPTGRSLERWEAEFDYPAVPRAGDYIETGYGDHPVEYVSWGRNGGVLVHLRTIYTTSDSMDAALARLTEGSESP
jgi:hypothetical protein